MYQIGACGLLEPSVDIEYDGGVSLGRPTLLDHSGTLTKVLTYL
jgi:hypothetical protein